jgi:O-Antigen ligase
VNVAASPAWTPPQTRPRTAGLLVVLLVGCLTTAVAVVLGNGNLVVAVAPIMVATVLAAIWFAPLRIPLLAVVFLSLAIDATDEGPWNSPLARVGALLSINLNQSIPVSALAFPGIVLIFALLLVIHFHRRMSGIRTDSVGRTPTANVSLQSLAASFLAVLALCALGYKNGGNLQMAKIQVQTFVLMLLVAYLTAMSFRGMRDYRTLGNVVLAAACVKSLYVVWVANNVNRLALAFEPTDGKLAVVATHGDSMLFACATVLLIVRFAERPVRRNAVLALSLLPLLAVGMALNNRRLVWVEVAVGLLMFWVLSRRSPLKRFVAHAVLASLPLIVGYVAVGWNSHSRIFAPVSMFRSVTDSDVDSSTLYRDLENYNLLATMRLNPFMGTGFGHPFAEIVTLPNISFFREYQYMPHNSVVGLWAFCGAFGFTGLALSLVVGVYLAARSYQSARSPEERIAANMVISVVLIYVIHCWGDIGFSERRSIFLVGPMLAMAGQLAVSTGAWRNRLARQQS